jgi:hypothetical protein
MLATHMIKARLAASKWRPFGRRKLFLVHGTGETLTVTAKMGVALLPEIGDEIMVIDVSDDRPYLARGQFRRTRLYVNFEKQGLVPDGGYAVWMSGSTISEAQRNARPVQYECMSNMVDDWFTTVEDEVALTLLVVEHGGPLRISNDLMTRL